MLYRNKKTGDLIDSKSKLAGAWEEYIPSKAPVIDDTKEPEAVKEEKEPVKQKTKSKGMKKTIDDVTIANIKQELDAFGIKYSSSATKAELWDLMFKRK